MADSSLKMQSRWDWANLSGSKKFSQTVQVYRNVRPSATTLNSFPIVVTKNKVRGKGRALQLRFVSDPGKDAEILGWGIYITKNGRP